MDFKEQVKRDIANVFQNAKEFAEMTNIEYNGRKYNIPVVIDRDLARDRKKPSRDNTEGIFTVDLVVFISFYDLGIIPNKNTKIIIDGYKYNIIKVSEVMGEITLELEVFDE